MTKYFLFVVILVSVVAVSGCLGQAASYCDDEDIDSVYECGDGSIKVVSSLLGGGYTVYKMDGSSFTCPVVAPNYMSDECKNFQENVQCSDINICEP